MLIENIGEKNGRSPYFMDERRKKILKAVVEEYVSSAEPVGSKLLFEKYNFGVSPATLRSEMQALEEESYLLQPHTSAGRIPSDKGYRYYVNNFTSFENSGRLSKETYFKKLKNFSENLEELLEGTVNLLYDLTHYFSACVYCLPDEYSISEFQLVLLELKKILVLIFTRAGLVNKVLENILAEGQNITQEELNKLGRFFSQELVGTDIRRLAKEKKLFEKLLILEEDLRKIGAKIVQALQSESFLSAAAEEKVVVKGTTSIVKEPEFFDEEKLAAFFKIIDEKRRLVHFIENSALGEDFIVKIGAENQNQAMKNCSVVISRLNFSEKKQGLLSLIGPTRMNYRRAIPAVQALSEILSDFFI